MRFHSQKLLIALFSLGIFGSCSPVKTPVGVSVSPRLGEVMLDPSSKGTVKMKFQVPVDYLSKRGRLLITPRLVVPDGEVADMYEPVAVDAPVYAKKIYRKKVLEGYVDSLSGQVVRADRWSELMEIPYETRVAVPEGWDDAYIDALVSVEGCASCGIIDTLFVAKLRQSEPVDTFSLQWIRPTLAKRPKVMEGKGIAVLQFTINRSDIDGSLGDNRAELEKMAKTLRPILEDSLASVHSIHIIGMASADGPFGFNTNLAYQRAVAAGRWLQDRMAIAPEMKERILADVRPEGWEPVLEAMRQAGDPDAADVEAILERYPADSNNDDVQEREIRRLSCWERIRTNYLQRDRKVEYRYTYTLKSFTSDEELLRMYATRPDAFSEEEFFRVAELMPSLTEKIEAYRKLLAYYPASEVGKNNLAVLEHEWQMMNSRKGGVK